MDVGNHDVDALPQAVAGEREPEIGPYRVTAVPSLRITSVMDVDGRAV